MSPQRARRPKSRVSFLHFSDVHFSGTADSYEPSKVLRSFLRTCRTWVDRSGPPDLVFFTGDIGHRGVEGDYARATKFFDELLTALGTDVDALWLVPGNHDVDRSRGRLLLRSFPTASEADEAFFAEPGHRRPFQDKFAAYRDFVKRYFGDRALALGDVVHAPKTVEVNGVRLGIAPFNSAWFSQADDDMGKLWIGSRLVEDRFEELQGSDPHLTVALVHHPIHYLHERETAGAWLRQQFDVILRGHLHNAETIRSTTTSTTVLEIAAGALYQGEHQPCRAFFCNLDVDLDLERALLRLEPYWFVESPAATEWVVDTTVFPDCASTGYCAEVTLPLRRPTPRIASPDPGRPEAVSFPFDSWQAVVTPQWLPAISAWFAESYPVNPHRAVEAVVEHCTEILAEARSQPNFDSSVRNLAVALTGVLPQDGQLDTAHHLALLRLLASGVGAYVSHLFMLPTVDLLALATNKAYVDLLAATRSLASGDLEMAETLARSVGEGCCVAAFVIGQSLRKRERNIEAKVNLEEVARILGRRRSAGALRCNASPTLSCMCNPLLLEAELERALGVVGRRMRQPDVANNRFRRATRLALSALEDSPAHGAPSETRPDNLPVDFDVAPLRVVADIHYSFGYFLLERGDRSQAGELFDAAIEALEQSGIEWDSPYTRRGLVLLMEGQPDRALEMLARARAICSRTRPAVNREAILSLALCSLGLRLAAAHVAGAHVDVDVMSDLRTALRATPPLGAGALRCHLDDARRLQGVLTPSTQSEWQRFTDELEQALAT